MDKKKKSREEYCPFPDRKCEECPFYWLDGCVLVDGKSLLNGISKEQLNGMEE